MTLLDDRRRLLVALASLPVAAAALPAAAAPQQPAQPATSRSRDKAPVRKAPASEHPARGARAADKRQAHGARAADRRPAPGPAYAGHAAVAAFAADVAARRGLDRAWIEAQLGLARRIEASRQLVMPAPAGSAKNWAAYRARFVEPQRVAAGVAFWREHARWLDLAEQQHGVPAAIVCGIVGVETFYGRVLGHFRIVDVLATLAFDFPPGRRDRSAFFRAELEAFFVFCNRDGRDPQQPTGSFAGAMGLPQFMPSSLNTYAVDFDDSGHIDLQGSGADVVGSVANYLASFGWQRGMATHFAVQPPTDPVALADLLAPDIVPSFTAAQFAERGAVLDAAGRAHEGLLALVALQNGESAAASVVAGTQNFYVITRYNWSSYYAMAVIELAAAVAAARV